jgi:hypothetical protein
MQYLLFAGDDLYPDGGASDLKDRFATMEECYDVITRLGFVWWKIYDMQLDTVIDSSFI